MSDSSDFNNWDLATHKARIADMGSCIRYAAGSPDSEEILLCQRLLLNDGLRSPSKKRFLILGMTPELRRMALATGMEVVSVDKSRHAIELFRDWVPEEFRHRERTIQRNWLGLDEEEAWAFDAIMGDGVFGNVLSLQEHYHLFEKLRCVLDPDGIIILRQVIIPDVFKFEDNTCAALLKRFRAGSMSEEGFGFSMRLWGCFDQAYDPGSFLLNNRTVFNHYRESLREGILSQSEFDLIWRYYYDGLNMILPQWGWEEILSEAGFAFEAHFLEGREWYEYFPVYSCWLK